MGKNDLRRYELCFHFLKLFNTCIIVFVTEGKKPTPKPTAEGQIVPTAHPGTDLQLLPTLTATPSAGTIVCDHGWTQEMNVDTPDDGDNGDYETIPNLRKKYAFCDVGNIITARCYKAGTNTTHDHTGETVTCDPTTGLACNNWDQLNQSSGKCSDYSIRFYCNCKSSKFSTLESGIFLAHLAKGHVSFCHHLASVRPSVVRKLFTF